MEKQLLLIMKWITSDPSQISLKWPCVSFFLRVLRWNIEKHLGSFQHQQDYWAILYRGSSVSEEWGVRVQERVQDIRELVAWIQVWRVRQSRVGFNLCFNKASWVCLPALCCFFPKKVERDKNLSSVERRDSLSKGKKGWQYRDDVSEKNGK